MPYTPNSRVMHVNDVAGVASTLVTYAQQQGRHWKLRLLPSGAGPLLQAATRRALDLASWLGERRYAQLLHVHYGPNGYLCWGIKTPSVLHLHGSDVRVDLHRTGISQLTRQAIARADVVLYSTMDLQEAVLSERPDAQWMPNPLSVETFSAQPAPHIQGRVVFSTRWDSTKGAQALARAARTLKNHGLDVHGLDWGADVDLAKEAGVTMHPLMPREAFLDFLASGEIVVGQHSFGVPGMTELQAMAIGRPVAMYAPDIPVLHTDSDTLSDSIIDALNTPSHLADLAAHGQQWARAHHHPEVVLERLEAVYAQLLG